MYGLPQAGILANTRLRTLLSKHGYMQCKNTHDLFCHHTQKSTFILVVDDFGIKYMSESNLQHLITAVRELYTITIDKSGTLYCGLTMKWDYKRRHVNISMPGYIERTLAEFLDYTIT